MEETITKLADVGPGPATVTLADGTERELEIEAIEVAGSSLSAEAVSREARDSRYRIDRPPDEGGPLTLEARSLPGGEWEAVGNVASVEPDG